MPERLLQFVPFLATDCGGGRPKLNTARLLEIGLTILAVWYGISISVAKIETKLDSVEKHVSILDDRIFLHMADSEARDARRGR